MIGRMIALLCVLATAWPSVAQPLPEGVIAQLGKSRFAAQPGDGVALSPDGKLIVVGRDTFRSTDASKYMGGNLILNADTGKLVREIEASDKSWPRALAWSANGRLIASFSSDTKFQIWHAATGKPLWGDNMGQLENKSALFVRAIRFVNDDRLMAVVCMHRFSKTWHVELLDVEPGTRSSTWSVDQGKRTALKALGDGYDIRHVALSPSGAHMAWLAVPPPDAKDGRSAVFVYETTTGKLLHTVKDLPRTHRADLPDEGETLVLHPVRPAKVEKIITAQAAVVGVPDGRLRFHCAYRFRPTAMITPWTHATSPAQTVSIDRAAIRFRASLLTLDEVGMIRWDLKNGQKQDEYNEPFSSFALSADGKRIAVRQGRRIGVCDSELASLKSPGVYAFDLSLQLRFLADGRLLGNDSPGDQDGLLHVWEPRKRVLLDTRRIYASPAGYGLSGWDSKWSTYLYEHETTDGHFVTYDRTANERVAVLEGLKNARGFLSDDGKRVLAYAREKDRLVVRWFDARIGRELGRRDIPDQELYPARRLDREAQWFSEDGSVFGYVTSDLRLALVDCSGAKVVLTLGIAPAKKWTWPEWDYQSAGYHRLLWARPTYRSVDGANASAAEHAIWDRQGRLLRRFSLSAEVQRQGLQLLSADGRMIAVYAKESEIVFFETATGRSRGRMRLAGPISGAHLQSVDFSPDGTMLATSWNGTILLWDLARPLSGKAALTTPTSVKEADALWNNLGDPDPTESDRALWALVKAPEHALAMLKDRLKPVPTPDAKIVQALVKKLDSGNFAERDAAQKELRGMNASVLSLLREPRKGATPEQSRRLDEVIAEMQSRLDSPDAIRVNLRELRALEVLERIGTPEARSTVETVARGGDALVTFEAQLILTRWQNPQ